MTSPIIPIYLLTVCFSFSAALPNEGYVPEKGKIEIHSSARHLVNWGEDLAAHTHGPWQKYQANEYTLREKKIRPFWVDTLYHGGWNYGKGFQPKVGQFRVSNAFGVWEHDPATKQLKFRFIWPGSSTDSGFYDGVHDCYWENHGKHSHDLVLIQFNQVHDEPIKNLKAVKSTLGRYQTTDREGRLHFDEGAWATLKKNELRFYDLRKQKGKAPEVKQVTTEPPTIKFGPLRNVKAFGKQFTDCGISFSMLTDWVQWHKEDREGRCWIHAKHLYCLDFGHLVAPKYDEFVKLLPLAFGDDSIKATHAMHHLLLAEHYKAWVTEMLNSENEEVQNAARKLQAAIDGEDPLHFSGYLEQWKQLKSGKGKPAEILPRPKVNQPKPFVESCPLILNTAKAGHLKNYKLIDTPIFKPLGLKFQNSGAFLHSPNYIRNLYLKVEVDANDTMSIHEMKSAGDIYNLKRGAKAGQALAQIHTKHGHEVGLMDIKTGEFTPLAMVSKDSRYQHIAMDPQERLVMMCGDGLSIGYQKETGDEVFELKLKHPEQAAWNGNILWQNNSIFLYRSIYERQWEGEHSDIKTFKDGKIVTLNNKLPGNIYHLCIVSKDTLLVATRHPSNMFFVNSTTGKVSKELFQIKRAKENYTFLPDALTDSQGNFWFYTNWVDGEVNHGRLYKWDGKQLTTFLEWQFSVKKQSLLNPYTGNMTLTENGEIWLAMHDRMLVVDTKTSSHRFFRIHDRKGIPVLSTYKGRVMARFGHDAAPAIFSLEKK